MKLAGFPVLMVLLALPAKADSVFAARTLNPREVITAESLLIRDADVPGAARHLEDVIGLEVVRAVYAGHPVLTDNLSAAAVIERNALVRAVFSVNGLSIEIEARALERGAVGDVIRAMNLSSRNTIRAEVQPNGHLKVVP